MHWLFFVGLTTAAALAPTERQIDPELRRIARDTPTRVTGAVVELRDADTVRDLEARGVVFRRGRSGEVLHVGAFHPVDAPASTLRALRADGLQLTVGRPRPTDPTSVTGDEVGTWAVQAHGPTPLAGPDGEGITILDIDQGIDLFHPHFFRTDAGAHPWVDVDGDGVLTPSVDGVDTNGDGEIEDFERLRLLDYASFKSAGTQTEFGGLDGAFNPWFDYLYVDFDGNGTRDFGIAAGYEESSPGYGEALFVPDDANGDGALDPSERILLLGTSKISAYRRGSIVLRRGEDLISAPRDTPAVADHGTSVVGSLVGGQDVLYRAHRGLVPGADVALFAYLGADTDADFVEGIAWGITDANATVVLHEYAEWQEVHLDGSRALDVALEESAAEGIVHVCPAGNLADAGKHAQLSVGAEPVSFPFNVPASNTYSFARIDLHWPDTGVDLQCTLTNPGQQAIVVVEGSQTLGGLSVQAERFDSARGTAMLDILIGGTTPAGNWSLECEHGAPSLEVHAYLDDSVTGWNRGIVFTQEVTATTLCSPSTSDGCLAIAAYQLQHPTSGPEGEIQDYSSRGPRMNGGKTIDIAAPCDPWTPYAQILDPTASGFPGPAAQNYYRIFGGTSGAGPHVAAAAALLQQAEPELSGLEVGQRITDAAITDEFAEIGTAPDDAWGHGKLRAYEALYDEPAPARPTFVSRDLTVDFVPADGECTVEIGVPDVDWTGPSFRWDDDYDGTWDSEFTPSAARQIVVAADVTEINVRAEYGAQGWRVGGAALTAQVPTECFEAGTGSGGSETTGPGDSTSDGSGSEGGAGENDDGGGCGCRGTTTPPLGGSMALVLLALGLRRRRR